MSAPVNAPGLKRRQLLFGAAALAAAPRAASAQAQPDFEVPGMEHVLTIRADLAAAAPPEPGPDGERVKIPITGGVVEGSGIRGEVLPGDADWQRVRADGVRELDASYEFVTDDGAIVRVFNRGLIVAGQGGVYFRTAPRFEAPVGPYDWLNKAIFLGTVETPPPGEDLTYVIVRVFRVT